VEVVIDARLILPRMTGIGRYLCGLTNGLRELPGGHQFELWIQPDLSDEHPIFQTPGDNVSLRQVPISHMTIRQQWAVPRQLRRRQPDLFHYPHFDLPWLAPGPVVVTIHDLKYVSHPEFFPNLSRVKRFLMFAIMKLTVQRAGRIIAVSESTRRDIMRYLRAQPQKVAVVYEGVEPLYFSRPPEEAMAAMRHRYGLEGPFVLFVGERRPHKNIVGVLRAFAALRHRGHTTHHLVIAGKQYATYREPERLTQALDLEKTVHFLDYVPDEDLLPLYSAADAFILLSLYEGFGLPVLEAMASGTPVVASNVTALPEVVGEAGLLVPPHEPDQAAHALFRILTQEPTRKDLTARGLTRARQFTWKACAERTLQVYRNASG
jgi:glycosyltransferase involved in cell wall biosynthesis